MPYCITLRSRTDATITGWYAGRNCRWSTDRQRQIRFDNPDDASAFRVPSGGERGTGGRAFPPPGALEPQRAQGVP
jgi:hypothetical protein